MISHRDNVRQICYMDLCTGCGTCEAVCPRSAIEMKLSDGQGYYLPWIDEDRCNNCGFCLKVCPGQTVNLKELSQNIMQDSKKSDSIGYYQNCYIGYSKNDLIRQSSSSGGLITQVLIFLLQEGLIDGAIVTRMKENNPLEAETFIARTEKDIIEASGSKYCPVSANSALGKILESEDGMRFAVVGLPCHLHGIRKLEQLNRRIQNKIVLHLGLFCSSSKTTFATDYQLDKMNINKEEIKSIKYRGSGWPGSFSVTLRNGTQFSESHNVYYDDIFSSFTPWRCTLCIDETSELADISFGDAWLPEIKQRDNKGTSIVISRSAIGDRILRLISEKGLVNLSLIDDNTISKSQGNSVRKKLFSARYKVSKYLFMRQCPTYDTYLENGSILNYIIVLNFYLKITLANRRYLRGLLILYCHFVKRVRKEFGSLMHNVLH